MKKHALGRMAGRNVPRVPANVPPPPPLVKIPVDPEVLAKIASWDICRNLAPGPESRDPELAARNLEDVIPVAYTWLPDRELDTLLTKILGLKEMRELPALIEPVHEILVTTRPGRHHYNNFEIAVTQEQRVNALRTIAQHLAMRPGSNEAVDKFIYEVGKLYDLHELDALAEQLLDHLLKNRPLPEGIDQAIEYYRSLGAHMSMKQTTLKEIAAYLKRVRSIEEKRSGPGYLTGGRRKRCSRRKKLRGRRNRSIRRRC